MKKIGRRDTLGTLALLSVGGVGLFACSSSDGDGASDGEGGDGGSDPGGSGSGGTSNGGSGEGGSTTTTGGTSNPGGSAGSGGTTASGGTESGGTDSGGSGGTDSGGSGGTGGSETGGDGGDANGGSATGGSGGSGGTGCSDAIDAQITCRHGHEMIVPLADIEAGVEQTYNIQGSATHGHDVTVTAEQFAQLAAGEEVVIFVPSAFQPHNVHLSCAAGLDPAALDDTECN